MLRGETIYSFDAYTADLTHVMTFHIDIYSIAIVICSLSFIGLGVFTLLIMSAIMK